MAAMDPSSAVAAAAEGGGEDPFQGGEELTEGTVIRRRSRSGSGSRVVATEGSRARQMDGLGDAAVRADGEVTEEMTEEKRRLAKIRELNRVGNKKIFDAELDKVWDREESGEADTDEKTMSSDRPGFDAPGALADLDLSGKPTKMKSAAARRRAEAKRRAEAAVLGEYQRGPGERGGMMGTDPGTGGGDGDYADGDGARAGDGDGDGFGPDVDGREYGWDQADVKAMQKQYEDFLKTSKANKWWKRGDE